MIIINFSGLKQIYWYPIFNWDFGKGDGLWFLEGKWLGIQATLYSRESAIEIIHRVYSEPNN